MSSDNDEFHYSYFHELGEAFTDRNVFLIEELLFYWPKGQ